MNNPRVLFLTQLLPFPQDNGGKVKTLRTLKLLKGLGCRVYLTCFVDKKEHLKQQEKLKNICSQTQAFFHPVITKSHKHVMAKTFFSLFSPKPFAVYKYFSPKMRDFLRLVVKREQFDMIYVDHLHLAQYLDHLEIKVPIFYDEHNVSSLAYWRNFQIETNPIEKIAYLIEAMRWRLYERKYLTKFEKIFAISPVDKQRLIGLGAHPGQVIVLPTPFTVNHLFRFNPKRRTILFVGLLSWKPNEDAFWWFYQKVLPLVKKKVGEVTFTVIGANPSKKMRLVAQNDQAIQVLGYVDDLKRWFRASSVFVAPIRSGGGVRIKILTAMSMGLPVVSTTLGAEGIEAEKGRELAIADTAEQFASQVGNVLTDGKLAQGLSLAGRKFIQRNYNNSMAKKILSANLCP